MSKIKSFGEILRECNPYYIRSFGEILREGIVIEYDETLKKISEAYNPAVPLAVNNSEVTNNNAKHYFVIHNQRGEQIWPDQNGSLDLVESVRQLYQLRNRRNILVKYNPNLGRPENPQPPLVRFVNIMFRQSTETVDEIVSTIQKFNSNFSRPEFEKFLNKHYGKELVNAVFRAA